MVDAANARVGGPRRPSAGLRRIRLRPQPARLRPRLRRGPANRAIARHRQRDPHAAAHAGRRNRARTTIAGEPPTPRSPASPTRSSEAKATTRSSRCSIPTTTSRPTSSSSRKIRRNTYSRNATGARIGHPRESKAKSPSFDTLPHVPYLSDKSVTYVRSTGRMS